jgi:hypothetical protein
MSSKGRKLAGGAAAAAAAVVLLRWTMTITETDNFWLFF